MLFKTEKCLEHSYEQLFLRVHDLFSLMSHILILENFDTGVGSPKIIQKLFFNLITAKELLQCVHCQTKVLYIRYVEKAQTQLEKLYFFSWTWKEC